jgi:ribokinase
MNSWSYKGSASEITVVGHTAFDNICKTPYLPPPNGSAPVIKRDILFGGGAANIAVGIATLGQRVTLVSAVGKDFLGSEYEKKLKKLGVSLENYILPEEHTATAFMFTDESGAQMTFFEWGASRAFAQNNPSAFSFVHMATADPLYNTNVARLATFSSFDPGQDVRLYTKEYLEPLLNCIDILIGNTYEYDVMCQTMACSRKDLATQVPLAIETVGGDGSIIRVHDEEIHIPAVNVKMVDPSGAGDAYRAGFLSACIQGYDVITCAQVGTVSASFAVCAVGCQTDLCDFATMQKRYETEFGTLPSPPRKLPQITQNNQDK